MPRTAATPEQRERARNRIRKAAAQVVREEGPGAVTVRAIAMRAGVSTGTVYSYFENLADLMRSLWEDPTAEADAHMEAVARAHANPVRRIRALLRAYAEFAHRNEELYRGAFLFVRPTGAPAPVMQPLEEVAFYRLLRTALREGQLAGEVRRGSVDALAQTLWGGVHGALALPHNLDRFDFVPAERLSDEMIRMLVRAIAP